VGLYGNWSQGPVAVGAGKATRCELEDSMFESRWVKEIFSAV